MAGYGEGGVMRDWKLDLVTKDELYTRMVVDAGTNPAVPFTLVERLLVERDLALKELDEANKEIEHISDEYLDFLNRMQEKNMELRELLKRVVTK